MANNTYGHNENKTLVDLDVWVQDKGGGSSSAIEELRERVDNIWNVIYPVGSLYFSINSTSPAVLFGGTWEMFALGRTIIGVNPGTANYSNSNMIGGSEALAAHKHTYRSVLDRRGSRNSQDIWSIENASVARLGGEAMTYIAADLISENSKCDRVTIGGDTSTTGSGDSGNLPPYITCYIWKRKA